MSRGARAVKNQQPSSATVADPLRTTFRVPAPFDLGATMDSHGWLHAAPFRPDVSAKTLVRHDRIGRRVAEIRIRQGARTAQHTMLVVTADVAASDANRDAVRRIVRTSLGLDEDLAPFYALARREPRLRPILDHGAGRTLRAPTLWEDLVKMIVQTNTRWAQALKTYRALVTAGSRHTASGAYAFPAPRQLLDHGETWLLDTVRVGYRAPAIIELAERVASGALDLDAIERDAPQMDTGALVQRLQEIRGIGPASAHTLAGFMGKHDVIGTDSSTVAYVRAHYPDQYAGDKPTLSEATAAFDRYGEWKGKAWWYEAWLHRAVTGTGRTD